MLINLVIFRYMFAKTVVIQQLSRKCITYISKTITLIALRYWNSMTSATSNSQTQTLQACYCKLIESFDGFMLIWLHFQMAKYQYLPLFPSLSFWDCVSLSQSLIIIISYGLLSRHVSVSPECKITCCLNVWHRIAAIFFIFYIDDN